MANLPRLQLNENPDKKSDFIIFRYPIKNKNTKKNTKKSKRNTKKSKRKTKNNRKKGLFNLFS